ncbi:AAA family ATPase [Microcoleus sp. B7-D4]|uniref:AAA family ATPase n=1 Tax=Microcoleus sp. B7-D4 TaxID=2818696 RepID=UPI003B17C85E
MNRSASPVLICLSGLPFSGKTFLCTALKESLKATIVSYDDLWVKQSEENGSWQSWEQVTKIAHQHISKFLLPQSVVLFDNLGDTRAYRRTLQGLAKEKEAIFVILYLDTPASIRVKRWTENQETKHRHSVSKTRVSQKTQFEPPNRTEADLFVRVLPTTTLTDIYELVVTHIY